MWERQAKIWRGMHAVTAGPAVFQQPAKWDMGKNAAGSRLDAVRRSE